MVTENGDCSRLSARIALTLGALFAFIAVGAGAFGAHALKDRLPPDALAIWQTAVQYQAWHALALLAAGILLSRWPESGAFRASALLFAAGMVLFSGSLYALALGAPQAIGFVTPFGGIAFLLGWLALAWGACRSRAR